MSTTTATLHDGRRVVLTPRSVIASSRPRRAAFTASPSLPKIALPIDWSKDGTLPFPVLGNDQEGDCMYCMIVHGDQTMTGNVGTESRYDAGTVLRYYRKLSPFDQGLSDEQAASEWHRGLCGNPEASILDSLSIDPTDDDLLNSAIYLYGHACFELSVPNRWINAARQDAVWDAPARPNPANGHGTLLNGVDKDNRKRLQTWGFNVWITPDGIKSCDASAWVGFSLRWFDRDGIAPNGFSYDQLAAYWVAAGGSPLPPSPFKSPMPPIA